MVKSAGRPRVSTYFPNRRVNETLNPRDHFLHPVPILIDNRLGYIFEEKGRGFFIWNQISGAIAKIEDSQLDHIIMKLKDGG